MTEGVSSEFRPSGKQLVFIFMASTVVAVVVFLCGVMVGRGVPFSRNVEFNAMAGAEDDNLQILSSDPVFVASVDVEGEMVVAPDEFTYFGRLESEEAQPEIFKNAETIRDLSTAANVPNPVNQLSRDAAVVSNSLQTERGFTVQIAALHGRVEAGIIVDGLIAEGYPAYLLEPAPDAPSRVYRVRVGRYLDRSEAEDIRRRLEKEEQFKPWITR